MTVWIDRYCRLLERAIVLLLRERWRTVSGDQRDDELVMVQESQNLAQVNPLPSTTCPQPSTVEDSKIDPGTTTMRRVTFLREATRWARTYCAGRCRCPTGCA